MTLEYKILWIDDEPDSVEAKRGQIKEYLEAEKGFDCKIFPIESYKKYMEEYSQKSDINDFDLLIVDFKLDDQEVQDAHSGYEIIRDIRDTKRIYTEVIFYSSHYSDLVTKLKDSETYVEGIFTSPRAELEIKIQEILDVIIKKVQDVNNLRGLIMAEVAELDRIKERILVKYSTIKSDRTIESYLLEKLKKSYDDNLKRVDSHAEKSITEIIENLYVDSDKKARAIKKINSAFDELAYRVSILKKRNSFAHIEENMIEGQRMIGDIPFTEDECVKIRKDIKEYKAILEVIEKEL